MLCQKSLHESCSMGRRIVVMKLISSLGRCECYGHTVHKLSQWRLTADCLAPRESDCSRRHSKVCPAAMLYQGHATGSRDIQNDWKLSGQPSYFYSSLYPMAFYGVTFTLTLSFIIYKYLLQCILPHLSPTWRDTAETRSLNKHEISNGFGGLGVACWPLVPKFAGSNPAEAVGILGRKNPQHAFGPI